MYSLYLLCGLSIHKHKHTAPSPRSEISRRPSHDTHAGYKYLDRVGVARTSAGGLRGPSQLSRATVRGPMRPSRIGSLRRWCVGGKKTRSRVVTRGGAGDAQTCAIRAGGQATPRTRRSSTHRHSAAPAAGAHPCARHPLSLPVEGGALWARGLPLPARPRSRLPHSALLGLRSPYRTLVCCRAASRLLPRVTAAAAPRHSCCRAASPLLPRRVSAAAAEPEECKRRGGRRGAAL